MTTKLKQLHTMKRVFYIIGLVVVVYACNGSKESKKDTEMATYVPLKDEGEFEAKVAQIDMNDSLVEVSSLYYTKEDGSSYEVSAWLDDKSHILKMKETSVEGTSGKYGSVTFYFDNGRKIVSNEHFEEKQGNKANFVERITYYNPAGKSLKSKQRIAVYEEELDRALFQACAPANCSSKNAEDALNQKGSFITTFQGFVENGPQMFLTVGEHKKDGYVSALLIQYTDSNIKKLMDDQENMVGTKLTVNFEKMTDETGFQFQVLTGIKFK